MEAALIVLDGWGLGPTDDPERRNAVAAADTATFDAYWDRGASGQLSVSGRDVGLPDGQMGNSEVGHLNIGAGRVVYHEYTRINDAIRASSLSTFDTGEQQHTSDEPFDANTAITAAIEHVREHDGQLHLLGLVSDGGVHADYRHLFALIELAAARDVTAITHAFTDGRDTDPTAGAGYLADLAAVIDAHGTGDVATVTGRYFAMDRDQNWERTARAYQAIVHGDGAHNAASAEAAIQSAYDRGETDEFVEPTTINGGTELTASDAIMFINFRSDRARQLVRMLGDVHADDWTADGIETAPPSIPITTMTSYDQSFSFPVAYPPMRPTDTLGAVWEETGCTQLRIAESEKYPHVTYFLNGGREVKFTGESRRIIPSPDVPTYDQQPEMSAEAVTAEALDVITTTDPDAMVLNFANPDMVGHTGDFAAAVRAVETVDHQLQRLVPAIQAAGGHVLLTADHGNADNMGTTTAPHTAHTANNVPLVYLAPDGGDGGYHIPATGRLADIAPTMLWLMGLDTSENMTGQCLLAPIDAQGNS